MDRRVLRNGLQRTTALLAAALFLCPRPSLASLGYATDFKLEKRTDLAGEPVFCDFVIRNTGSETFVFPHRAPTRALNPELGSEPRFVLTDARGRRLADPGPHPCGGAKGRVVYGSVTLPPGQTSVERWVLNQWGEILSPGVYHLHAERHLPLHAAGSSLAGRPAAYALAVDDLAFEVVRGNTPELERAYRPLLTNLQNPRDPHFDEAVVAITAVPHPFLQSQLLKLLGNDSANYPWVRQQALEGLARLGTPSAWEAVLKFALGQSGADGQTGETNESLALRGEAILLLAEKGDAEFVPGLLNLLRSGPEQLEPSVLAALGFFHDPRANQALFDRLHSPRPGDRINAILGLKNLNTADAIPALLAMLNDPNEQVRQVANFALERLTGQKFVLPPAASRAQLARTMADWENWWQKNNATFTPAPALVCRDW